MIKNNFLTGIFSVIFLMVTSSFSSFAGANKFSFGQSEDTAKVSAATLINGLKQGALLVRLKTSENLINGLTERGRIKEAEELKKRQAEINKEVYKAFKDKYKFGQVYFFYSTNTDKVKSGKTEGIFLDSTLNADSSITINNNKFYIAEIGDIHSETTNSSRYGLRIMNAEMKEINFKDYSYLQSVWQVDMLKFKIRTPADMVETFDKRLHKVAEKF